MTKYTKEDIETLADQIRRNKDRKKPFYLLTGAGCSKTAGIPLAFELVKEIHLKFPNECKRLSEAQRYDYGACMNRLVKNEIRELLENYLKNSKINWAHIAIASMMEAGFISRVITFNFDDVLARACSLLGIYPATYDFAAAATVQTDYIAERAVIHLHGQGSGPVLLNTDHDTKQHVENIRPLFRTTFTEHSLLVVGYSGSSDAVFPMLTEEFKGAERLWWAGYEEEPNASIKGFINKYENAINYVGNCDADKFLLDLAKALNCFPPKLFKNPYEHLLAELDPVVEFPITESFSTDLLKKTREILLQAQQALENIEISLENLLMQGNWQAVIDQSDVNNPEHKESLCWALFNQGYEILNTAAKEKNIEQYYHGIEKYRWATEINPNFHEVYFNWAVALHHLADLESDGSLYEESFTKYRHVIETNPDDYEAYKNWGLALANLAKLKSSDLLYKESIEKYQKAIEINADCYEAYLSWGNLLSYRADLMSDDALFEESFEKYQRVIEIKPDYEIAYEDWGVGLIKQFHLTYKKEYLIKAKEISEELERLRPSQVYNLACAYSLLKEKAKCKQKLLVCKEHKTLPTKEHLLTDPDLENVRGEKWFQDLIKE